MQIPGFRGDLRVEIAESDGVFLLAEDDVIQLSGALYRLVVPLIDGRRSADDIVELTRDRASAAEVHYAIGRLAAQGYVVEADGGAPDAGAVFWQVQRADPPRARAALAAARVRVIAAGDAAPGDVIAALTAEGLAVVDGGPAALTIVVADDYLRDAVADHNRAALLAGAPWIAVRPLGRTMWIGPRFTPGVTACWECLAARLRMHRHVEAMLQRRRPEVSLVRPARAAQAGAARAVAHLLAAAVARGVVTGDDGLGDTLVALDTIGFATEHHRVVRRPQCPACGDPGLVATQQQRAVVLASRAKLFTAEAGHRAVRPDDTLRRYGHHVSPVTGVVRALEQVHDGDGVAPIFDAGDNLARRTGDVIMLKHTLRSRSGGKGATATQARASGLCEAIERYAGVAHGDEARQRASFVELGDRAVHPQRWLLFSDRQYAEAARARPVHRKVSQLVPPRFDDRRPIDWSPAWSLTADARRYLPSALCFYDHRDDGPAFGWADSNGCAAGNTVEEAILQGFLELVERDSVALWWYHRTRRPRVDLDRLDEPYLGRVAAYYERLGRELWVLDVTSDLGIPAFAAVSRRRDGQPEEIVVGFGAHLEARIGILRAITEMNQFLPYLSGPMAGKPVGDPDVAAWLGGATLAEQRYLAPADDRPAIDPSRYPRLWTGDLRDDVIACVEIARRAGLELIVLDQTRPDVGLPVVRVVVPGMRHFWARFGPGRLHDVPLALGWIDRPTPEDELNPIAVFF